MVEPAVLRYNTLEQTFEFIKQTFSKRAKIYTDEKLFFTKKEIQLLKDQGIEELLIYSEKYNTLLSEDYKPLKHFKKREKYNKLLIVVLFLFVILIAIYYFIIEGRITFPIKNELGEYPPFPEYS